MPVTLKVAPHGARVWEDPKVSTSEKLLQKLCPKEYSQSKYIIQTSFDKNVLHESHFTPSENGFVRAVYHAYSCHHHLTLRPEDVWFSILSQISLFVNAHAEDLRSFFVSHQGRRELGVWEFGNIQTVDFGELAVRMTDMIEENVVDPELRTWIMLSFSTTTLSDKVVAAVLMMGALQKYFKYTMVL